MANKNPSPNKPRDSNRDDPGKPGGVGRTDAVGRVPTDIHVDPEITEVHPGYEESGPSEIKPRRSPPKKIGCWSLAEHLGSA